MCRLEGDIGERWKQTPFHIFHPFWSWVYSLKCTRLSPPATSNVRFIYSFIYKCLSSICYKSVIGRGAGDVMVYMIACLSSGRLSMSNLPSSGR